jgi:protein SPT2
MTKPIPKLTPSAKASGARPSAIKSDKAPASKVKAKSSTVRPSSTGPSTARVPSKRSRSPTRSESPHSKRRAYDDYNSEDLDDDEEFGGGEGGSGMSSLIWQLMGKDRSRYVNMDVFSDDEDMEADADAVLREEQRRFVSMTQCLQLTHLIDFFLVLVLPNVRMRLP